MSNRPFMHAIAWGLIEVPEGVTTGTAEARLKLKRAVTKELYGSNVFICIEDPGGNYCVKIFEAPKAVHVSYKQACQVALRCLEGNPPTRIEVGWKCNDGRQMLISEMTD